MTLDYLVILLLLGLGIVALGYILEARSREAGVDLDGIRLRPWAADKYAGRPVYRVDGPSTWRNEWPTEWPADRLPATPEEYLLAVEAGWQEPELHASSTYLTKGGPS